MRDLGQILAGQAELIGEIVVSGGDDHFAGMVIARPSGAVGGGDAEFPVFAHDGFNPLVLANVEPVMLGDLAVVLESLLARGLLVRRGEWDLANFKQLGRGKKNHSCGVVKKRIHQAALVEHDDVKPEFLRFDGAGQAGRPCADHQDVGVHLGVRNSLDLGQSFDVFGGEKVGHWRLCDR